MTLKQKFHPNRFRCSPQFHAMIAFVLGEEWTTPSLCTMSITSDGFVVSLQNFLGSASEMEENFRGALNHVNATDKQKQEFWKRYKARVCDWRK